MSWCWHDFDYTNYQLSKMCKTEGSSSHILEVHMIDVDIWPNLYVALSGVPCHCSFACVFSRSSLPSPPPHRPATDSYDYSRRHPADEYIKNGLKRALPINVVVVIIVVVPLLILSDPWATAARSLCVTQSVSLQDCNRGTFRYDRCLPLLLVNTNEYREEVHCICT